MSGFSAPPRGSSSGYRRASFDFGFNPMQIAPWRGQSSKRGTLMPPSFGSQVELPPPPGEIIVPYVQRKPMKKDGAGVATSDEDRAMKEALGLNTSDAGTKFRECASKVECTLGDTVTAVALSRDNAVYAAAGMNKKALCYSTVDGSEIAVFVADAGINAIQMMGDSTRDIKLVAGTFSGLLRFYSVLYEREQLCVKFGAGGGVTRSWPSTNTTRLRRLAH